MLINKRKLHKNSAFSKFLQNIPLGIKVKLLVCLVVALLISPVVASFIESLIVRFSSIEEFAYFAYVQTAISLLTASLIILLLIGTLVISPLLEIIAATEKIGEGNLQDLAPIASRDEMGRLFSAIYNMKEELRRIVQNVGEVTAKIQQNSEEINRALDSNTAAIEQIAAGTNDFSSKAVEINSKTETIAKIAENAAKEMENGGQELAMVVKHTETSREAIKRSVDQIKELHSLAEEIGKVVQIIGDIAEETHLLSFNATIEAARAGEHGRGFSVVAEKVGKLADESKKSARDIKDVIDQIQKKTDNTARVIMESDTQIDTTSKAVAGAAVTIKKVIDAMDSLLKDIQAVAAYAGEINAAAQEIAASTQEQSASLQEVNTLTQEFHNTVRGLKQALSKFKL